ncbi:putative phage protein [Vibrio diabolicus]|nr:putative phage protein [Vibrio diabolicus]
MSKLSKFKTFYTLEETAERVSQSLGEPVSVSDICQFGLDHHLTISARLINHAQVLVGRCLRRESPEIKSYQVSYDFLTEEPLDEPYEVSLDEEALYLDNNMFIVFGEVIHCINDIWDLAMIGRESLALENIYQKENGGPEPIDSNMSGVYLTYENLVLSLQTPRFPIPSEENRIALGQKIDSILAPKELTFDDVFGDDFDQRIEYFTAQEQEELAELVDSVVGADNEHQRYRNSSTLDEHDYQFVVRAEELTRFIEELNKKPTEQPTEQPTEDKSLTVKERNTLLTFIGVLLKEQGLNPSTKGITPAIRLMTETAGTPISENTIRKILKQVSEITV